MSNIKTTSEAWAVKDQEDGYSLRNSVIRCTGLMITYWFPCRKKRNWQQDFSRCNSSLWHALQTPN